MFFNDFYNNNNKKSIFFFIILWCSWSGNHPQEDLSNFDIKNMTKNIIFILDQPTS